MVRLRRVARLRQVPARARQALNRIEATDRRTAVMAEAIGRLEGQLRDAERRLAEAEQQRERLRRQVALGHESTGRTHEDLWHILEEQQRRLADLRERLPAD